MESINENEQWKLQGDCTKCRRKTYCSKPCTHHKRTCEAKMKRLVFNTMNEMTGGAMGAMREIIESMGRKD